MSMIDELAFEELPGPALPEPCGLVYEIDRGARGEGPGLRSVVRLKGCPLRCVWCQNPEGQAFRPEVMLADDRCARCGRCSFACDHGRHYLTGEHHLLLGSHVCDGCQDCATACPYQALEAVGKVRTISELMALLEVDAPLYAATGGGVTVSGGEPLFQDEYALALLQALRDRGWHTALDTSGYAPPLLFAEVVGAIDLLLFDLKETNSDLHTAWCGVPFEPIRDNLELAAESGVEIWLRCPVVPPLNDRDDHWHHVGRLAAGFEPHPPVYLSPYYPIGEAKRRGLGRANLNLDGLEIPTAERLAQIAALLTGYGLDVRLPLAS